jgi:hypothetical protein
VVVVSYIIIGAMPPVTNVAQVIRFKFGGIVGTSGTTLRSVTGNGGTLGSVAGVGVGVDDDMMVEGGHGAQMVLRRVWMPVGRERGPPSEMMQEHLEEALGYMVDDGEMTSGSPVCCLKMWMSCRSLWRWLLVIGDSGKSGDGCRRAGERSCAAAMVRSIDE